MKFLFKIIIQNQQYRARKETLRILRSMPDKQLSDCGLSRDLIDEGLKAWPWRQVPENLHPLRLNQNAGVEEIQTESHLNIDLQDETAATTRNVA